MSGSSMLVRFPMFFLLAVTNAGWAHAKPMPEKLPPAFHHNRLDEVYRRSGDGLVLLRGEMDWFRKRELRAFDPSFRETNFKQEKNLYYLTGIEVPNSFVLIDPKKKEVHLYTDWDSEPEIEEARKLGISGIHPAAAFMRDARIRAEAYDILYTLYVPLLEDGTLFGKTHVMTGLFPPGMGEPVTEEQQFAKRLQEIFPGHRIKSLYPVVYDMQKIKRPEEIELLREANRVTVQGVLEAIRAIRPGIYDHDVRAAVEYTFVREGASATAFSANLMSGPNMFKKLVQLFSNYSHRDRKLEAGDAIFIDIGAEVSYYLSDVGRTVPVSGKFSPEQRRLYEVYLPCFLDSVRAVRPGVTQADLVNICADAVERQMPDLKEPYVRRAAEAFIQQIRSQPTLGHYVDMNVIGAGPQPDEPLEPGMVFAIEPVLYWEELDFAIFAEDIVLVTEDGYENLSPGMPYTVDEIEALMAEPSLLDREERE